MKKYLFLVLTVLFFVSPFLVQASILEGPLVQCGRANQAPCTLCDIFKLVQTIVNFISVGLFILAPIFIIYGGLMILLTGAKPSNLETGKSIIKNAIIGVIIALLAWVAINEILIVLAGSTDVEGKKVGSILQMPWNKIECTGGEVINRNTICTCGENTKIGSKEYASGTECSNNCSNYCKTNYSAQPGGDYGCCNEKIMENGCFTSPPAGEWCKRSAPSGSEKWVLNGIDSKQKGDANASLTNFLNCMYELVIDQYGNDNGLAINSISDDKLCSGSCNPSTGAGCSHTKNSCHYGGTNCSGASSAVDFRANVTNCKVIASFAQSCGGSNAWINWETNPEHLHVSLNNGTCGCNEGTTPNPCPQ